MPSGKVVRILVDDVEAEATAVAVEVQLVVAVLAHQLGRIECRTEREAQIADTQAERRLVGSLHFRVEMQTVIDALGLNLRPRHVEPCRDSPLRRRTGDEGRIDVALAVSHTQYAVHTMKKALCTGLMKGQC